MSITEDIKNVENLLNKLNNTPEQQNIITSYILCSCNTEYIRDIETNILICPSCGTVDIYKINTETNIYMDNIITQFQYKRIHHVAEQIRNIQSKIPVNLSCEMLELIKKEGKTPENTKCILKKYKLQNIYEKTPYINNILYNTPNIYINNIIYCKALVLFIKIENEYKKFNYLIKPQKNRKRFISVYYILYKIFLNLNEFEISKYIKKYIYKFDNKDEKYKEIYNQIKINLNLVY